MTIAPARPPAESPDFKHKLLAVTWPLIAIAALMLSLCVASLSTLSSIRAFVNGEGMWSKAERQAIAELHRFAHSGSPNDYLRFRVELAVTLGDRAARLELQSSHPDYALARAGFLAGRNHPDDVSGMMLLFRLFRHSALLARPIGAWTRADELILQLDEIGRQMQSGMMTAGPGRGRVEQLLTEAEGIHAEVAPLEDEFSASLGSTSRLVMKLLSLSLALCSIVLVGIGAAISRNMIRRSERIAAALRESEEQAFVAQARSHVTLQSIADAVLCTNRACEVTYLNAAAEQLIGWPAADAVGRPLATVLRILPEPNTHSVTSEIEQILAGEQRTGPAAGSLLQGRDGSTTPIHERAAPIRDSHGEVMGIVFVMRDITQERAFAAQLLHQATHDALTGLANRREFEQQLGWAILDRQRTGTDYALLYLDLDQFKVVNDTCGHAAGDELIRLVSWAVKQELRAGDVLARLGGDEFGILLANYPQQAALSLAESVRHRISALRFIWEGKVFSTNASIGVLSLTESLATVGDALSAADQACYMAKDNGRNRVQFYRPDDQEMRARHGEMRWVERLNRAIELDQFALFAQEIRPVGHPAAGAVEPSRFEVLIRMVDSDGTLIAPMAFIPAAERYGLMPRIDRWVIAKACSNLAALRERHGGIPMCMINLSGASVTDPGMVDFVRSQLQKFGLPRQSIGFELTETAAISNLANASQLMHGLKEIGCPMALDDFGSGMASFAYLRGFPVDYLKIDGEFVKDMTTDLVDYEIVEAIHNVGRVMGVKTVAESVENAEILAALMLVGVDFAQGFHIHRPVPMMDIAYRAARRRDALPLTRAAMSSVK
ncbi:MAG TPA: EAL domain-containing protein [Steroidobacteraceae bacterium]|nr:EAL domain-containing protein [Steroidobacteraceae bacterium]